MVKLALEANMLIIRLFRVRRRPGVDYARINSIIDRANRRADRRQRLVLRGL